MVIVDSGSLQLDMGSKRWRHLMIIIPPWLMWRLNSMRRKTGSLIWVWVEFITLWIKVRFATLRLPQQTIHNDLPFTTSDCSCTKPYCITDHWESQCAIQHPPHNTALHTKLVKSAGNTQVVLCSQTSCWPVLSVVMLHYQTLPVLIGLTLLHNDGGSSNCTVTFQCPLYSLPTGKQVAHYIQHCTQFHTFTWKLLCISNICYFQTEWIC